MATHSSILAWRIPWTEKPGRLHDLATKPPPLPPFFPKDRYSGIYFISDQVQEVILFTKRNRA